MDVLQRVACKALIVYEGKVLVLRESGHYDEATLVGKYEVPGGRINPGEPFMQGLHREVHEETGLAVEISDLLYADEWFPEIKGVKNHIVALFFVCKPASTDVVLSVEHDDFQWIDLQSLSSVELAVEDKRAIELYYQRYKVQPPKN